ncbi:hypothetical protein [Streptomyces phaeochromogenes]
MANNRKNVGKTPEGLEPVVIGQNKKPAEKVTLFILNDVEYQVPKKVDPRIGLRFAERLAEAQTENDQMVAQLTFVKELLGVEAYRALMDDPEVSPEDFDAVLELLQQVGLGKSEASKN